MELDLHIVWFCLIGALMAGYAILDGFDLGVGMLVPLAKNDYERQLMMASIGPIWDGNEVWLVTFGGALFAAFPQAYATVFSGFYIVFMLVLLALILRAVSLEFRNQLHSKVWRSTWDWVFFGSSALATMLFGVGVGNAIIGVMLNAHGDYTGGFWNLCNPYSICVGLLAVSMFVLHGCLYLLGKTTGEINARLQIWSPRILLVFIAMFAIATSWTLIDVPRVRSTLASYPVAWLMAVVSFVLIVALVRLVLQHRWRLAFIVSAFTILCSVVLLGVELFPNLVTSSDPSGEYSLTIYNASSSEKTLRIMLIIAALGLPFVLTYTGLVYWIFRGHVNVSDHG